MPIPDYQTLMLPVLAIAAGGETRVPITAEKIADQFGLTEAEREEMLPSGKQRLLHNRIHWAKFYMTKAGLVESPKRGIFVASPTGRQLLATNPTKIDVEALKVYPAFVDFTAPAQQPAPSPKHQPQRPQLYRLQPRKSRLTPHMQCLHRSCELISWRASSNRVPLSLSV